MQSIGFPGTTHAIAQVLGLVVQAGGSDGQTATEPEQIPWQDAVDLSVEHLGDAVSVLCMPGSRIVVTQCPV